MNDSGIVAARPRFDALFDEAVPRVLGATHVIDVPPRPGGGRWPVSVALMPNEVEGRRFTELMTQLLPFSGPGHFLTGHPAALHVTVRALEDRRNDTLVGVAHYGCSIRSGVALADVGYV